MLKKYIIAYLLGALIDTVMTYYFVGIARIAVEINPFNKIVEYNPNAYLVIQIVREAITITLVVYGTIYFYKVFSRINARISVIGTKIILDTAVFARWFPIIHNILSFFRLT